MKRRFNSEESEVENIDISPLIDVVFILLIFFIVSTVFIEETGVEVNKPDAASTQSLEKESILIAITNDRKIIYAKKNIGVKGVRTIVNTAMAKDATTPVILQADRSVPTELLIAVIDEAKLGGAKKVNVATSAL